MNAFEKMTHEIRKEVLIIDLKARKKITETYTDAIGNIGRQLEKMPKGSLQKRHAELLKKSLAQEIGKLNQQVDDITKGVTIDSSKVTVKGQQKMFETMIGETGFKVSGEFNEVFAKVHTDVIANIFTGELYKDNRSLSSRIWKANNVANGDIQYMLAQGIAEQKSAKDLAKDFEQFVKEPINRKAEWGKDYPRLRQKYIQANSLRLARTSGNHVYQTATVQASMPNPFIEGIKWHTQGSGACELCLERESQDNYDLGPGVYPKNAVPLDHPNGVCTLIPWITKSYDEIADALNKWGEGKEDPLGIDNLFKIDRKTKTIYPKEILKEED